MADDEWTRFISHQQRTVSCRTSYFSRLSVYDICSVNFLQWQLLPLKNLVATIVDSFVLFSWSCSTSSSNYLQLNYRLSLSSRRFLLLTSVSLWKLVSFLPGTGLISSCFYQQLTVATSCTSGTVNELSAFKNLFHLVCPYFTDHDLIANKMITRFLDLVISASDVSCELM
ncbi:uncharacterized protein [Dysidea avara]|uniref:uncharacterized protein n=1 Tax=Dysidea avara TaxID=196820 RepID=UPI00331A8A92